jgi:hypothetical protein
LVEAVVSGLNIPRHAGFKLEYEGRLVGHMHSGKSFSALRIRKGSKLALLE